MASAVPVVLAVTAVRGLTTVTSPELSAAQVPPVELAVPAAMVALAAPDQLRALLGLREMAAQAASAVQEGPDRQQVNRGPATVAPVEWVVRAAKVVRAPIVPPPVVSAS